MKFTTYISVLILSILTSCTETELPENLVLDMYIDENGYYYIADTDSNKYLIDTGVEKSILFEDKGISGGYAFDGLYKISNKKMAISKKVDIKIDDLIIKSHSFIILSRNNTIHHNDIHLAGIIGMDILSKRHWIFDNQTLSITMTSEPEELEKYDKILVLPYQRPLHPYLTLTINDIKFENILFDSGYNTFLAIKRKDHIKGKMRRKREQENTSFLNEKEKVTTTSYRSITINDIRFRGGTQVTRVPDNEDRIIGNHFLRHWSAWEINTNSQELNFYQ